MPLSGVDEARQIAVVFCHGMPGPVMSLTLQAAADKASGGRHDAVASAAKVFSADAAVAAALAAMELHDGAGYLTVTALDVTGAAPLSASLVASASTVTAVTGYGTASTPTSPARSSPESGSMTPGTAPAHSVMRSPCAATGSHLHPRRSHLLSRHAW